jgi:hypothetical protein
MFTGVKVNLPIEPPQFNETPTYALTVEIRKAYEAATGYNLTPKIIANLIRQQFGITGGSINMQLVSFGLWGVADATSIAPEVNCDVSCLSPNVDDNVSPTAPVGVYYGLAKKLRDTGTLNRPCKVGYRWSIADKSRVINENSDFEIVNWAMTGTATSILRVQVMFSFAGPAAPQGP